MIKMWDVTIPELTGFAKRLAYLYLPESYGDDPERRYPVLYMFDGHNVFFDSHATYGKSWGMKEYMEETQTQVIIVAVECNHGIHNDRLCEYAPYSFNDPDFGPVEGRGDIYMKWLIRDLKPMIDDTYLTLPDREHTMIAGSSMGGLMSLYAVLKYNHIFSRAACLSASIHFCPSDINRLIKRADLDPDTIIYMDFGSEEMNYFKEMKDECIEIISSLVHRNIYLSTRIVPGGTHSEASWERQIPFFMNTLLYEEEPETPDSPMDPE
ncbi:MAG: alpha/beta hydrolase [Eubacterium sp.]|nr:alpha/beta hydrolase [Eubacterium sp.]